MSTEARRASIPPRPATPPRPAQPPAVGESGPGSPSSEESVERAVVDPGGRTSDDSDWQAFGERDRRGSGTAARPTFGGFDWQGPRERDGHVPGNAQRGSADSGRSVGDMSAGRESGAGKEPSQGATAAGPPPIRTSNHTGPDATPARDESYGTSDTRRTDGDGSGRAPSTPADTSGAPAQPRTGPGAQAPRRQEPSGPAAPHPGSIPPPPPASARFPDTPPAPESPSTPPRRPAPGPMPPAPSAGNRAPGARPRPASQTPESYGPSTAGTSTHPRTPAPGPMPPASGAPSRATDTGGAAVPPRPRTQPTVPPRRTGAPAETVSETTFRMRPVPSAGNGRAESGGTAVPPMPDARPGSGARPAAPARPGFPPRPTRQAPVPGVTGAPPAPDPALSWSAALPQQQDATPGSGRPVVSFGEPEVGYKERSWGVRIPPRIAAVAACVVLGIGLIGGAVTGSWLIGGSGDEGRGDTFTQAGELWHSVPVDQLFPPTVDGQGAGPGGADRTWTRIAVAPDSGCRNAFDPLLRKALAPVGCERLLRATYADATQSYVTTVGLLFTDADATAMRELDTRFTREGLTSRTDLMPLPYAAKNTLAAGFGAGQRASWTISVLTDAPVVAYAVSGWADGRTVDTPEPAEKAMESGDTTPAAQAGLGNEAQGLADRVERALRKTVTSPPEQSS